MFAIASASRMAAARVPRATFSRMMSSESASFDISGSFETYNLGDLAPETTVECTKEDMLSYFQLMHTMRRMETSCDSEYKAGAIRGFCHLYDGQEAVATGANAAMTMEDSWITSYRCHCTALARGAQVEDILGELFGFEAGLTKGKGGSMHFYNKNANFFGGQGIVGAQVPVGVGLAFANKYNSKPGEEMPIAMACYGDGAANQGQIWESANMASLWKLPMIFCIENNHYGMGTSIDRHSSHSDYYKMGNHIPGLRIDGMNVLAVREGMRFAKEYVGSGKGPMYVEMMTYRYHGHSMSDPGLSYRNRDEVKLARDTRDPLGFVKKALVEADFATEDEIKSIEKSIRADVSERISKVKKSQPPGLDQLHTFIYAKDTVPGSGQEEVPFIRMPDYTKSIGNGH